MITGKQIREARALMGLQRSKFAERAGVPHAIVKLAEMTDGECPITVGRAHQIGRAIAAAGIELYVEGCDSGARLPGHAESVERASEGVEPLEAPRVASLDPTTQTVRDHNA